MMNMFARDARIGKKNTIEFDQTAMPSLKRVNPNEYYRMTVDQNKYMSLQKPIK